MRRGRLLLTLGVDQPEDPPVQRQDVVGSDGTVSPGLAIRLPWPFYRSIVVGWLSQPGGVSMSVRAKFVCQNKNESQGRVQLGPVYTGSEENKEFFKATPGGSIDLNILNEKALEQFEQGREYYIDFTPAAAK